MAEPDWDSIGRRFSQAWESPTQGWHGARPLPMVVGGGRQAGKSAALARAVRAHLEAGGSALLAHAGGVHRIVGVVGLDGGAGDAR